MSEPLSGTTTTTSAVLARLFTPWLPANYVSATVHGGFSAAQVEGGFESASVLGGFEPS